FSATLASGGLSGSGAPARVLPILCNSSWCSPAGPWAMCGPARYSLGESSPMSEPQKLAVVIFRENIEDVYSGIEYRAGSPEADAVIGFLTERFGAKIRPGSAIGIKPMSKFGSQRLVVKAIEYALRTGRRSVTLVHKGNIM